MPVPIDRQSKETVRPLPLGVECVRVYPAAGDMVVMAEVLEDGTVGEEHRVPRARFNAQRLERFKRYVEREQGRVRLALVR